MGHTHTQIVFMFIFQLICLILAATLSPENVNPLKLQPPCNQSEANCSSSPCHEICGCDRTYIFDEDKDECILNFAYLKELTASKNYINSENDMVLEDGLATKIQERVDKVFRGILSSALFVVFCCSICVLSVVLFCCHIHRSDRKLKNEVEAMAKEMNVDVRKKNKSSLRKPQDPVAESCNVVVQEANVMCV